MMKWLTVYQRKVQDRSKSSESGSGIQFDIFDLEEIWDKPLA